MGVCRDCVAGREYNVEGTLQPCNTQLLECVVCPGVAQEEIVNVGLKGLVFDAMMEPSNNKVNEVRKTKRAADSDAHTDAKQRKLLEPEASPTNHSLGGAAAEAANPPDRFSLVRRLSNHNRTGDAQGLFNVESQRLRS